jgi:hypothetical protein
MAGSAHPKTPPGSSVGDRFGLSVGGNCHVRNVADHAPLRRVIGERVTPAAARAGAGAAFVNVLTKRYSRSG